MSVGLGAAIFSLVGIILLIVGAAGLLVAGFVRMCED